MKEFKTGTGPFIHTKENYTKRIFSYLIVFIPFFVYTFYINGLTKNISSLIQTIIFSLIPIITVLLLETIYKILFVKNQSLKKYLKENFSLFSILFFPFLLNIKTPVYIIILSIIIAYIFYKTLFKKWYSLTILSYLVYLMISIISNSLELLPFYKTNNNYIELLLNGSNLMCPLISILSFIYLYIKKDIKKEITISSLLTILFITIIYGLTKKNLLYPLYFLLTGGTLFIITILANDFYSPTTKTGKILYGSIIGILIIILRFISKYDITPLSIFIANTFTFTFDYINEFINKKITYIGLIITILITLLIIILL